MTLTAKKTNAIKSLVSAIQGTDGAIQSEGATAWDALKAFSITKATAIRYLASGATERKDDEFRALREFRSLVATAMAENGTASNTENTNTKRTERSLERAVAGSTNLWRSYDREVAKTKGTLVKAEKQQRAPQTTGSRAASNIGDSLSQDDDTTGAVGSPDIAGANQNERPASQATAINKAWTAFALVQADIMKHLPKEKRNGFREDLDNATAKIRKAYA